MKYKHYPSRTAARNYFSMPNKIHTYHISPAAYAVYAFIRYNRKNDPQLDGMVEQLGLSKAKADKALKELAEQYLLVEMDGEYFLWWKGEEITNCYLLPNEIFNLGLSVGEIAVYGYLLCCENRVTYQCYPGYQTIGDAVGMSRNTVMKYVKALVDKRLIYTEPTTVWGKDGLKRNGTLLYTIRPIYEAIEYHAEMQMERMHIRSAVKPPA